MKQRIITAIIALIFFLPFVIIGDWPFTVLVYVMATVGLIELMRMRNIGKYSVSSVLAIGLLWLVMLPVEADIIPTGWISKSEIIMIVVMLLLSYTVLVKNKFTFDHAGFILLATLYVGMGFFFLIETRDAQQGLGNIIYVFFIVWATDTGAYFFGRAIGKNKLWPEISPNKTIEGAVGGIVLACVTGVAYHLINPFPYSMFIIIAVTILASIAGQIGDLVESAFKRHYGVKDSGDILPGHGGILDRFDSVLFVFPLLHFIQFI
ncbi:phosphatidate cytidylyltransferase [Virgibacillus sp. C22-A2]|uniref:Phosphatidate cytidylyltransferase n=1 Tax=Virgibacillus tibetensis TaxID=3042313 RepID=A0ABU6KBV5_9BACI|nr:phosphatidate cytidylyltransferase [Virgibacillus sp. C22-A2]